MLRDKYWLRKNKNPQFVLNCIIVSSTSPEAAEGLTAHVRDLHRHMPGCRVSPRSQDYIRQNMYYSKSPSHCCSSEVALVDLVTKHSDI